MKFHLLPPLILAQIVTFVSADWGVDGFEDASDLYHFVTRPELKPPRYYVDKHHPEAITPGHIFVSPYSAWSGVKDLDRKEHLPCQVGPAIYDADGELVWSGACQLWNQQGFDFKPIMMNGAVHMSFVTVGAFHYIMDSHYELVHDFYQQNMDPHEYNVLGSDGQFALCTTAWEQAGDGVQLYNTGFTKIDLRSKERVFRWNPLEHGVSVDDNTRPRAQVMSSNNLDFFHINSADTNAAGDYLISARYPETVYKVSGKDGHVIWKLGGTKSDFTFTDPSTIFHYQHDARFHFENDTHTIVSIFDNGATESSAVEPSFSGSSSAKFFLLDTSSQPMTATVIRHLPRPDHRITDKTGGVQLLGPGASWNDASVLTNWAYGGYITEHDAQNRLVFEARFKSLRYNTYRAYKTHGDMKFVGHPREQPVIKIQWMDGPGAGAEGLSALYVSWNGATEVKSWAFFGSDTEHGAFHELTVVKKKGFETSVVVPGRVHFAYAEARDATGKVLGAAPKTPFAEAATFQRLVAADAPATFQQEESSEGWLERLQMPAMTVLALIGAYNVLRFLFRRTHWDVCCSSRRHAGSPWRRKYTAVPTSENDLESKGSIVDVRVLE